MRKFGLVGFPLGHSFSKQYFTDKFISESIPDCSYENYEVRNIELLGELVLSDSEICGLNITIPYKTEILQYCDVVDNEATEVGAVNVLKIRHSNGKQFIRGTNTDIFGFRESLVPYLIGRNISGAIILGTGGGAKAVEYVLDKLGISCIKVSRRAQENCISYARLTDEIISQNRLIVNTTPLGMYPDTENCPDINFDSIGSGHILYDLVYNPENSLFLKKGKRHGALTIGGLKMLHLQAERSWKIWNDPDF